eukprot:evm.model.scf_521.5 EVM.evm.TU.scf_521.5   scf_521:37593-43085(+)
MDVPVDPALSANVHGQLVALNARHRAVESLVGDYLVCLRTCQDTAVRNMQLRKEADELRDEVLEKQSRLEALARRAARAQQLERVESRLEEATTERDGLRQKVSELESQLGEATASNENLTSQNEEYQAQVATCEENIAQLKADAESLSERLKQQEVSTAVAVEELESHRGRAAGWEKQVEKLSRENGELLRRIQEMAAEQMKKLQEVMDLEEAVVQREAKVGRMERQVTIEREYESSKVGGFALGPLGSLFPPQVRHRPPSTAKDKHRRRLFDAVDAIDKDRGNGKVVAILTDVIKALNDKQKPSEDSDFEIVASEEGRPPVAEQEVVVPKAAFRGASHKGGCTSLAYSPNGMLLATGGMDKVVSTWYPPTRLRQNDLKAFDSVMDVAFTCNGEHVLGGGVDKSVLVWQALSGRQRHTLRGHTRGVNCVVCSPADPTRAISSGEDRAIISWDLARGQQLASLCPNSQVCAVCYTISHDTIMSGHMDGTIRLWDLRASKIVLDKTQVHSNMIVSLQRLESGKVLSAGKDNCLKLWDLSQSKVLAEFWARDFQIGTIGAMGKCRCSVCCSPDERFIVAGTTAGTLTVWDTKEPSAAKKVQVLRTPHHREPVVGCAWGRQGDMASCDKAGVVVFWRDVPVE